MARAAFVVVFIGLAATLAASSCQTTISVDTSSGTASGGGGGRASTSVSGSTSSSSGATGAGGAGGSGGAGQGASGSGGSNGSGGAGGGGPQVCNTGACPSPSDVSGFQPTWIPPTGAHQNACSAALITQYYDECLGSAGSCTFETGTAEMQACAQCLTSQFTDPTWGPLILTPGLVSTNTAGCVALLDPSQMGCAQAIEAETECQYAACDPVCGVDGDPGFDDWVTCSAAANECGCQSWFAASNCGQSLASATSPAAPCFIGQTFEDDYYTIATLFCGP